MNILIKKSDPLLFTISRQLIILASLIFIFLSFNANELFAIQPCDSSSIRSCIGRALTITQSSGKTSQYVDVTYTNSWNQLIDAMTVEMWIKPQRQPGKTIFIAGLWGPGQEKHDEWVIYFDPAENLVFELNGDIADVGKADNTIVTTPGSSLFDNWNHITCVFDGSIQTAFIYINGVQVASARNSNYPMALLKGVRDPEFPIQIGSSNALTNDLNNNRTMLGQIDEVRIWSKAIPASLMICQKDLAYFDKVPDMILYYRCNEFPNVYNLCDVTGNGNFGRLRSGANCQNNDRKYTDQVISNTLKIVDTLRCENSKTYTILITDTSACGTRMYAREIDYSNKVNQVLQVDGTSKDLIPGVPTAFTFTYQSNVVGTYNTRFQILRTNICGTNFTIPVSITRISEISSSKTLVDYGIVLANCVDKPYVDSTVRICNNSAQVGTPRTITVSSISTKFPNIFRIASNPTSFTLAPGECRDIIIRFLPGDTSATYLDTLTIVSDDKCQNIAKIPLSGQAQEVIGIYRRDGKTRLDSIDFREICLNYLSDVTEYTWENLLLDDDIFVKEVRIPQQFFTGRLRFPILLEPETSYQPNYFRFQPTQSGVFIDSIVIVVDAGSCLVEKKIYIKGKGFFADLQFQVPNVDFGSVIVGQSNTISIPVKNNSDATLRVSFYFRGGKVFYINGPRAIDIPAGQTRNVIVDFVPTEPIDYSDELCLFEGKCFTSRCLPLKGKGILERFRYEPIVMRTENVVGCKDRLDTLAIFNLSSQAQIMSGIDFNPKGKFFLEYPNPIPGSINIASNDSTTFIFRYAPNDVTQDRADRAYLTYETQDKEMWSAQLIGTSINPRIFVPEETFFGQLEVGDSKIDTLIIENSSPFPISIDNITVSPGFNILFPANPVNRVLKSRDTLMVIIQFLPDSDRDFAGLITIESNDPCPVSYSGKLYGKGIVIPLEVPLTVVSFGFTYPCDCAIRKIPVINNSLTFDRIIDDIFIDGQDVSPAYPEFFSWTSFINPAGTLPYAIPPQSRDTIYVKYCPKSLANRDSIDHSAKIHISASGTGWSGGVFDSYLIGKRQLFMEPFPRFVGFPPTRVDVNSAPLPVEIWIPETAVNPGRRSLVIDSVSFLPDERVFSVVLPGADSFPVTIDTADSPYAFDVVFRPRAVRQYAAKLVLHLHEPCADIDTTIMVQGSSFAPPYAMEFTFNKQTSGLDTFRVSICDTIVIPIFSTREIPANFVDIKSRIIYDDSKLLLIGADSYYIDNQCQPHASQILIDDAPTFATDLVCKNFCKVDSINSWINLKFLPITNSRDTLKIVIDSIKFDTEEIILYEIICDNDSAIVVILEPDFDILNAVDFGTVDVLDFADRIVTIQNTGDIPLSIDDILNLPPQVTIESIVPPPPQLLGVGESATVTLRYRPIRKDTIDTDVFVNSLLPCFIDDTTALIGQSFAPPFPFKVHFSTQFDSDAAFSASLGDTLSVPVFMEKDFFRNIKGVDYWLLKLNFDVRLNYNPRALKLIQHSPSGNAAYSIDYQHGDIVFQFRNIDSMRAGELFSLKFLVTVPDSVLSAMALNSENINTGDILFLDLIPIPTRAQFTSIGKCNLSFLNYSGNAPIVRQNSPNPWADATKIVFSIDSNTPVMLSLRNSNGLVIDDLISGNADLDKGTYEIDYYNAELQSGIYYFHFQAGAYSKIIKTIVVK